MEISIFLFKRSLADQHPIINLASSKTLPAANQVGPRDTSGHETLPVLELLDTSSLEVFGHVWPWDKSSPETNPALNCWDKSRPKTCLALRQVQPPNSSGFKTSCTTFNNFCFFSALLLSFFMEQQFKHPRLDSPWNSSLSTRFL